MPQSVDQVIATIKDSLGGSNDDKNPDTVDVPGCVYAKRKPIWDMLDALLGGTEAMRAAAEDYLPREDKEDQSAYETRLHRSFLYNALGDTVDRLASKPFSKAVSLTDDNLPEPLSEISENVDRSGRDITAFGREVFEAAVTYGLSHILVDYPHVPAQSTLADERQLGARPTFVHIKPSQLLGTRTETQSDGSEQLTMIRILEMRTEAVGQFSEREVPHIRVISTDSWQLWRQDVDAEDGKDRTKWTLVEEGAHTFGSVPLITFYTKRVGFLDAEPPLLDLAWLNIAHWQSNSDQRNILRFIRMGILFAKGWDEEQVKAGIIVGPNHVVSTTSPDADLKYVEHTGSAVSAGQADIDKLEERMEVLGLQPLMNRSKGSTATGKVIDESSTHTDIQSWIRGLESVLEQCYEFAAQWVGQKIPDDFTIDINNEFGLTEAMASTTVVTLLSMCTAGKLDNETFLNECKRRGFLADSVTVRDVLDKISQEGPPLGALGGGANQPAPAVTKTNVPVGGKGNAVGKGASKVVNG